MMPYRRLPNADQARIRALKAAVVKGDVCNVYDLAASLKILGEARMFLTKFEAAHSYYVHCYGEQGRNSKKHQANVKAARLYISHFIQVLDPAVIRAEIKESHKNMYSLPVDNFGVPDLNSEASIAEWGQEIIEGERQRISRGGIPIYNPTTAKVKVHYDILMEGYGEQKNLQLFTNRSLEQFSSIRAQADRSILDIWNQVEVKCQEVLPNEKRLEKCRDYGLTYYYRTGEKTNKEIL